METYVGRVARKPVIRPKVIFTSVEIEDGKTLQAVVFPNRVSYSVKNAFSNANIDDKIAFTGKREVNNYNGEEQIVVASIQGEETNDSKHSNVHESTSSYPSSITIPAEVTEFTDTSGRKWFTLPDRF